jgi:hypothetical protein
MPPAFQCERVKACLDRATGAVDLGPDPENGAQYFDELRT